MVKYMEGYLHKKERRKKWIEYWVVLHGIYLKFQRHKLQNEDVGNRLIGWIELNEGLIKIMLIDCLNAEYLACFCNLQSFSPALKFFTPSKASVSYSQLLIKKMSVSDEARSSAQRLRWGGGRR